MSKVLISENHTLKVYELPKFMTVGKEVEIEKVPGVKEIVSVPCAQGEYQLIDDTYLVYIDNGKYHIYNIETLDEKIFEFKKEEAALLEFHVLDGIILFFEVKNEKRIRVNIISDDKVKSFKPHYTEEVGFISFNNRKYVTDVVGLNIVGIYDIDIDLYISTYPGQCLNFDENINAICEYNGNKTIAMYFYDDGCYNKITTKSTENTLLFRKVFDIELVLEVDLIGSMIFSVFDVSNNCIITAKKDHYLRMVSWSNKHFIIEKDLYNPDLLFAVYDMDQKKFLPKTFVNSYIEIMELNDSNDKLIIEREEGSNAIVSLYFTFDDFECQIVAGTNNYLTYKEKADYILVKDRSGIIREKIQINK